MLASADAALRQARHLLIERGELPSAEIVGQTVARSWCRCVDAGLAPVGRLPDAPHLDSFQFARTVGRRHEFVAHARPVMEYLYAQTRDSGCLVLLADDLGVVLQTLGDVDFVGRAERVALMQGASWHERHRGTNAIGTALAESRPVVVHGAEHFLDRNGFLTCAAAPISAPDGRWLGVLDISGDQRGRQPHTLSLVRAAAQMIENRLFETLHGDALRLRFHPLAEGIGTIAEGVVALSEDGCIVGANQSALVLLGLVPADLGATAITRVLRATMPAIVEWGRRHGRQAMPAVRSTGERLFVRVDSSRTHSRVFMPPERIERDAFSDLDTGDAQVKLAIDKARRIVDKPIALLLQGESGAGKELFAKAFHNAGPRRGKPFVAVNCSTLPENVIDAELFGYAPGAGARKEGVPGRIRAALGGTLFLDEIGELPLPQQARLLRVLQGPDAVPGCGGEPLDVDFTLVCATHRNLRADVETGRFRADLYYRINGLTLMLPALRERSDLAALVSCILEQLAPERALALDDALVAAFAAYAWPGNLRQLANALRTACALIDAGETIIGWQHLPDDLAEELRAAAETPSLSRQPSGAEAASGRHERRRRARPPDSASSRAPAGRR